MSPNGLHWAQNSLHMLTYDAAHRCVRACAPHIYTNPGKCDGFDQLLGRLDVRRSGFFTRGSHALGSEPTQPRYDRRGDH